MDRERVDSKLLKSVGYDPTGKVLEVEFQSGKVYRYFNVEPERYETMIHEKSMGSYFLAKIKGEYDYRKVEPDEVETQVE